MFANNVVALDLRANVMMLDMFFFIDLIFVKHLFFYLSFVGSPSPSDFAITYYCL